MIQTTTQQSLLSLIGSAKLSSSETDSCKWGWIRDTDLSITAVISPRQKYQQADSRGEGETAQIGALEQVLYKESGKPQKYRRWTLWHCEQHNTTQQPVGSVGNENSAEGRLRKKHSNNWRINRHGADLWWWRSSRWVPATLCLRIQCSPGWWPAAGSLRWKAGATPSWRVPPWTWAVECALTCVGWKRSKDQGKYSKGVLKVLQHNIQGPLRIHFFKNWTSSRCFSAYLDRKGLRKKNIINN